MSSTASPTPSPTSSSPPGGNGTPQSSALYLFTFLATLLLLLAVSCAIVVRSFILRRRFRRRIEEAIAAGVLIPGALEDGPGGAMGRRRRDFGEKPKLWEVWVDEHGLMHDTASDHEFNMKGEGKWEDILPVSATLLSNKLASAPDVNQPDGNAEEPISRRRAFLQSMFPRRPNLSNQTPMQRHEPTTPTNGNVTPPSPLPPTKEQSGEDDVLQVSVLISMPNPNARRMHGSDSSDVSLKGKGRGPGFEDTDGESELPDVVIGVTEVSMRP